MKQRKRRLDEELVAQGHCATPDQALRLILAGQVHTEDTTCTSAGQLVVEGTPLFVKGAKQYVSRGGLKLQGALDAFGIDPAHLRCLDIGCSSGGFTDVLLSRNAASVAAVDVGYAQFSWKLRQDSRVQLFERTNIIDFAADTQSRFDLVVCDVSFTSPLAFFEVFERLIVLGGSACVLVKPQFLAARELVEAGGIVRDPEVRRACVVAVIERFLQADFEVPGVCMSPIRGHKGNKEFFVWARRSQSPTVCSYELLDEISW